MWIIIIPNAIMNHWIISLLKMSIWDVVNKSYNKEKESKKKSELAEAEKIPPSQKAISNLYEIVSVFVSAVIIIMIIFTFICRFVGVIGQSMEPTLNSGDWLVISQLPLEYKPAQGDIVVISQPNIYNENIVKRVIATGGQTVDINFESGYVFVDGVLQNETYINNSTTTSGDVTFPVTVPEGYVFVMGDNRQHSTDSRFSAIGLIRDDYILGKASFALKSGQGTVKL